MAIIDFFDRGCRISPAGTAYVQDDLRYTFQEAGELSWRTANASLADGFAKETNGAVWAGNDVTAWICTLGLWRPNLAWIPVDAHKIAESNREILDDFDCEVVLLQVALAPLIAQLRAGLPKGVMNTHRSVQTFVAHVMLTFPYGVDENPVKLAPAPMTHTAGALTLPATAQGGTVVVVTSPEPDLMLEQIAKRRVTGFFRPPTVIYRLLGVPGIEQVAFSSLKCLLYGAAPMSVEKLKKAIAVFGPVMAGACGQTETPASIAYLPPAEHFEVGELGSEERLSSAGRPGPLIRVEIMNDDSQVLRTGETGEICLRGDLVMKGYYKAPELTAQAIVNGWLYTGDIGHLDADGYLYITDREKDMIISGGLYVYPSEVEQVIWSHPKVQDCGIIGVPDAGWGEAVKAVVELNPSETVTPRCSSPCARTRSATSVHRTWSTSSRPGRVARSARCSKRAFGTATGPRRQGRAGLRTASSPAGGLTDD